jgi:hypothetical protein
LPPYLENRFEQVFALDRHLLFLFEINGSIARLP